MDQPSKNHLKALDVESLRAFRELVALGGFTAASRKLGITQPAVSLRIRRLEQRTGMSLLDRQGRKFTVTPQGRELLAHAESVIGAHDRLVDSMRRSELSGQILIGCSGALAAGELLPVVGRLKQSHPDIGLTMRMGESRDISRMLDNGEIDCAILHLVELDEEMRCTDEIWRQDELHVVQGNDVDFTREDPVPIISYGPDSRFHLQLTDLLEAAGRRYRYAMEWTSVGGVQCAIEVGLGVGLLNSPSVTDKMKPWTGIDPIDLPSTTFILRTRTQQGSDDLINTLRAHLSLDSAARPFESMEQNNKE